MRQTVTIPTPTPPPVPPSQGLGEQIGDLARGIAQNAIAEARAEVQAELSQALAEQAGLRAALDAQRSGPARREITQQLREADLKVEKLQEALTKLESKTVTRVQRGGTFAGTTPAPNFPNLNPPSHFDPTPLVFGVMGILFVAFPLTLAMVRFLWKRASNAPAPAITAEQARRFDRLEQSMDAIAIEIERISENQRYLTKVLGESRPSAKIGS